MIDVRLLRSVLPFALLLVLSVGEAHAAPVPTADLSASRFAAPLGPVSASTQATAVQTEATRGVWPWVRWHRRQVRPRFSFEQRLQVRTRRGRGVQTTRLTVRTIYHYRVLRARRSFARVEVVIDAIEAYRRGRFIGRIDRIPRRLRTVRADVRRDGRIRFNRDVLLVGAPGLGFELVATRPHQGGFHRKRPKILAVGRVKPRQGRVVPVRYSQLLNRHRSRVIPTPLIPDDVDRFYAGVAGPYRYDAYGYGDLHGKEKTRPGHRRPGPPSHVPPQARRSASARGTTTGAEPRTRSWRHREDVRDDPRGRGARSRDAREGDRDDVRERRERREESREHREERAEERRERLEEQKEERRERAEERRERTEERRERREDGRARSSIRRVDTTRYDVDDAEVTVRRETRVRRLDDG